MSEQTLKRNLAAIAEAEKARGTVSIDRDTTIRKKLRVLDAIAKMEGQTPDPIYSQAADTIERLQAQVAELQAKLKRESALVDVRIQERMNPARRMGDSGY